MIYLDTSTRKLEIVLGVAKTTNDMHVVTCYYDVPRRDVGVGLEYLGGSAVASTNGTTPVTIVAAPSSNAIRNVTMITVNNYDTAAKVVTIRLDANGTDYNIISKSLNAGETLVFTHAGAGWQVL